MARPGTPQPPPSSTPDPSRAGDSGGIRLFLGATFLSFLVGVTVLTLLRRGGEEPALPGGPGTGVSSPETVPVFVDVTRQAGIRYRHETGATGRYYYPEVMGAGCAWFDCDGDGDLDIYFVNGNRLPPQSPDADITNVLYRNEGGGRFTEVTEATGTGDASYGQGCAAADYDGDGDQDLYVTNYGPNVLYRNRGDGTFEKLEGKLDDAGWGQACAFFDSDGDGDLDLYLQNYLEYALSDREDWYVSVGGEKVLDYCSPSGYRGQQDRLYRNDGGDSFKDVTRESGIVMPDGTGMGLVTADLDNDGDPDIVVSNDSRPNFYFRNEGNGRFTQCALILGIAYNGEGGTEAFMGVDAGDYDGDGFLDVVIPSLRSEGFNLYRNRNGTFTDVSVQAGLDAATGTCTGFAPVFLDYDSDGDLDLFFTTGEVRMGRTEATAEGSFKERYAMRSLLLENREGRFFNVSSVAGGFFNEKHISRACSAGDFDDDGDLDLLVTAMGGEARLLRNDTAGGNWVGFRLVGKAPNTDAVGARLTLRVGSRTLMREIHAGGSYLGQHDRRVVFGLGDAETFDELHVRWPGGAERTWSGLEAGRYHVLNEAGQ